MTPRALQLCHRIAALLADGPVYCRDAYAALLAEGYGLHFIRRERSRVVAIVGTTKGAEWTLRRDWRQRIDGATKKRRRGMVPEQLENLKRGNQTRADRAAALAEERQAARAKRAAERAASSPRAKALPRRQRPTAPPIQRVARVCEGCGKPIGMRREGEPRLCLRCQYEREVAA